MVRLVDYSSSSGSDSDSDSGPSWRSFGAPPSDSDASSAAMDMRSPPPTPPIGASPAREAVRGSRDAPIEIDEPPSATRSFSRAAGDPARLRSAFADSPFRRKSARVWAGDGSAASPMEVSDDDQSENVDVLQQPMVNGFRQEQRSSFRSEPVRKHRTTGSSGDGGQAGVQTGPEFVFGQAEKPEFSFGRTQGFASRESWRDRAAPPTQTNAFFRTTSDFVAGNAAGSTQRAGFSFRPSASAFASAATATPPVKRRDFTFGAPHARQEKAAADPTPPPPRKSVSEAFVELNGSPGFSTGVSNPSSRVGHRSRRRKTASSSAQSEAPAAQPAAPATTPAVSAPAFDFSKKNSAGLFNGFSAGNYQTNTGNGDFASYDTFSFGRANRFAGVAGNAGVKSTAAFTSTSSNSPTAGGETSSSSPTPSVKSSVFSWVKSLPTGQATGGSNNPTSYTSTQDTSPFAFRHQFGRRESSTGQPVVDNLKTNFGDFSIGTTGTPRKQSRSRRRSGLFSGRSMNEESSQSSQNSQTGSPFGLGASASSNSRERQQAGKNPPADMFATPVYQAAKPNSTTANPHITAKFLRRSSMRRGARPSIAARQASTFGAYNTSVDQNDAEMDSGEDDCDWRELKRLGGEAHVAQKYFEATEFYRQSIDALDYFLDRFPDLRTDSLTQDKAKLHANRAASLMMLMQITEAQRECRASIGADPGYTRAYLRLGRIQVMLGDLVDARCNLSIAKRLIADDVRKKRNVNSTLADQADITKTEEAIRKLSALQGEIKWCLDVGDLRQGLAHVEVALGLAPSCRTLQLQKARILIDQKNYDKIKRYCSDLLQKHRSFDSKASDSGGGGEATPDELKEVARIGVELALLWATALHYQNKVDDAMRLLTSLELAAPSSVKVMQLKRQWMDMQEAKQQANELFKRGDFQRAIPLYSQALCLDPKHDEYCAVIYCNRAAALMNLERYHTALVDCDEALQRKPQYPRALLRKARCYMVLKQYNEAVSSFNQYLQAYGSTLAPDVVLAVERERNQAKAGVAKEAEERRQARQAKKQAEEDRSRRARGGWEGSTFYDSYRRTSGFASGRSSSSGDKSKRASFMAPKTQRRTHYDVLGISSQSTAEEIKKAYRRLALVYHPDKSSVAGHEELFKEMTAAYTVLSDASARAKYDRELRYHRFGNFYEN